MSLNKLLLIGNILKDAETMDFSTSSVAKFTVVTSRKYKDRNGDMQEDREFHAIELWGSKGVYPYLVKGQQVYIEGSVVTDRWEDAEGNKREKKKVLAVICQLLGCKGGNDGQQQQPSRKPAAVDPYDDIF